MNLQLYQLSCIQVDTQVSPTCPCLKVIYFFGLATWRVPYRSPTCRMSLECPRGIQQAVWSVGDVLQSTTASNTTFIWINSTFAFYCNIVFLYSVMLCIMANE